MNNKLQKITSIILVLALVAGCFAAMPLKANAGAYTNQGPFDKADSYTIFENSYGYGYELGYHNNVRGDVLNNDGDIFPIKVTNTKDEVFYSFCFHGGSRNFAGQSIGCSGYMQTYNFPEDSVDDALSQYADLSYTRLLKAYNYIDEQFGDLDDNRAITQIVTWILLGLIDNSPAGLDKINWVNVENGGDRVNAVSEPRAKVERVMQCYESQSGGRIYELVILVCNENHDIEFCQPQLVPVYRYPSMKTGGLQIEKTVDGVAFNTWFEGYDEAEVNAIISDIAFKLCKLSDDGTSTVVAWGTIDDGFISFEYDGDLAPGWYEVIEILTGKAAKIFETPEAIQIYVNSGEQAFVNTFVNTDFYTIVNGYGSGYVLGYNGLNNGGDIFPISIKSSSGVAYSSFCAHGGSTHFAGESGLGCVGYYHAKTFDPVKDLDNGAQIADFIAAYNYIEANIGDLTENRAITQIITWILLGHITMDRLDDINWPLVNANNDYYTGNDAKLDVENVIANYKNEPCPDGMVLDVAFMVCENPEHSYNTCQPQLVPIYGEDATFDNTPQQPELCSLQISADFGTYYGVSGSITGGYSGEGQTARDSQTHNLEVELGGKGDWFQFNGKAEGKNKKANDVVMDFTGTQKSYTFDLVQGDKLTKVGEYTITYNGLTDKGGKSFTVTFASKDGKYALNAVGARLSISSVVQPFKNKNDKGFNANFIWTTSPGQQQFSFSGNSYTFTAPEGGKTADGKDYKLDLSNVKVYIHLEGINGYINTKFQDPSLKVVVINEEFGINREVLLTRTKPSQTIDELKAGVYYIEIFGRPETKIGYDVSGELTTVVL